MPENIYNRFRRITTNQLYFPEIDGIRFLAIVLVVLFHIHGYFIKKSSYAIDATSYPLLETFLRNGDRGVELFFVLSGFILCLPFAHYYINQGRPVSLKRYYLRRVTRLEPPYFVAMTALLLIHLAANLRPASVLVPHWLASLGYVHNFIYHKVPMLTVVAWSLEIEIQFYLLAPLLFKVLQLTPVARRTVLVLAPVVIIYLQNVYPPYFLNLYRFIQYFLVGILLADLYVSNAFAAQMNNRLLPFVAFTCMVGVMALPVSNYGIDLYILYGSQLCFPFLIGLLYYIILKNGPLKRIFGYKFLPVIGGMCYSIYLLHYTIISFIGRYTIGLHIGTGYLVNLALQVVLLSVPVLLLSAVYYYYIERPFMSGKWMEMILRKGKKEADMNTVS